MPDAPDRTHPHAPQGQGTGLILGIETSCDETAAAVVRHGTDILSSVVASQISLHANFGGVVPELASREHLRNLVPVVRAAIAQAAVKHPGLTLHSLDAIAVTRGPGLAGALLVGITYARALALALGKPLLAINHLEGHIHAVLMDNPQPASKSSDQPPGPPESDPTLALVVSGGHTHLYLAHQAPAGQGSESRLWHYRNIGRTVDDAAGEAFDKVAKLLGLGYPGGPWIDALAPLGNPLAVPFTFAPIKPRTYPPNANPAQLLNPKTRHTPPSPADDPSAPGPVPGTGVAPPPQAPHPTFDLSFSGIKTAVLRYTQLHAMAPAIEGRRRHFAAQLDLKPTPTTIAHLQTLNLLDPQTLDLLSSFQHAVIGNLLKQTFAAAQLHGARTILVSGGVSANAELRRRFTAEATRRGLSVAFPSLSLATDNAAMIAAAAWPRLLAGDLAPDDLTATPQLRLGETSANSSTDCTDQREAHGEAPRRVMK